MTLKRVKPEMSEELVGAMAKLFAPFERGVIDAAGFLAAQQRLIEVYVRTSEEARR